MIKAKVKKIKAKDAPPPTYKFVIELSEDEAREFKDRLGVTTFAGNVLYKLYLALEPHFKDTNHEAEPFGVKWKGCNL